MTTSLPAYFRVKPNRALMFPEGVIDPHRHRLATWAQGGALVKVSEPEALEWLGEKGRSNRVEQVDGRNLGGEVAVGLPPHALAYIHKLRQTQPEAAAEKVAAGAKAASRKKKASRKKAPNPEEVAPEVLPPTSEPDAAADTPAVADSEE